MTREASSGGFTRRIETALADPGLRANFNAAMTYLRDRRGAVLGDADEFQRLQTRCRQIREDALGRLPELLEQLESRCMANGIQVHWAADAQEACQVIQGIIQGHQGKRVVKGKSMASEEIGLNHALEAMGIECIETDMGEFIVQLAGETPSHIIMPAIHKTREQIGQLFATHLEGVPYTDQVDELIGGGRRILREKFLAADIGITGVNFAVAETGTLCLVENEGNGRLSSGAPPVHIALAGIDKVIPRLTDLAPLLSLLTRSATGQIITTYVNLISAPRRSEERDGPREVHLVLLDNGRSGIHADPQLRQTLLCIRCGACMNHCPVYARIGGHAYGTVYPGPIGQVLMPQIEGQRRHGELTEACSLNAACGEVCPVGIPLADLIRRLREERVRPITDLASASEAPWLEATIWRLWRAICTNPRLYRLVTWLASRGRHLLPPLPRAWTRHRTLPRPAPDSLHRQLQRRHPARPTHPAKLADAVHTAKPGSRKPGTPGSTPP